MFCKAFGMGLNRQRSAVWNGMKSVIIEPVKAITEKVTSAFEGMKGIVLDVWEGIKTGIKAVLNGIILIINKFIDGFNLPAELLNKIPKKTHLISPLHPGAAKGNVFICGSAIVGEAGPELIEKREVCESHASICRRKGTRRF
ncbi:hypothetical protein P7H17_25475 [Paenibacillus larvae]|nr:hypothetical protein [Paenibacillus larvae]MDT2288728.1 hypothetical protein [Paenibacillus larvae]